ncbi:hypothetical protein GJ699_18115 [Duganella sp. FT80W]|uniref:Uncharacterized protein n=1 Tax=Duganella guangzhouensis TaxID=2666084 RepID=A0A6I2L4W1_9BURK|nr:hypothetical protein [Duganella guangzhouensis]
MTWLGAFIGGIPVKYNVVQISSYLFNVVFGEICFNIRGWGIYVRASVIISFI